MKGADLVSEFLERTGTAVVYGVSGANCEDIFESIHQKQKTKIILSKSEYGAATMAIGYYLAHKKIGVVLTTSGPGILNTIPVLAEAYTSKIPLLVIAGSVDESFEGRKSFQDTSGKNGSLELSPMLAACTRFHEKAGSAGENLFELLYKGMEQALLNLGPVVIEIPKNISQKEFVDSHAFVTRERVINQDVFNQAVYFCESVAADASNEPLIVLGDECMHLSSASVSLLAENLDAQIVATPNAKGIVDNLSARYAGLLGIMGHESARAAFKKASHVLYLGFTEDMLSTIGIEADLPLKTNFHLSYEKCGDMDAVLKKLCSYSFTEKKKNRSASKTLPVRGTTFTMENILAEIQSKQNKDCNVFVDAGNTGAYVVHNYLCTGSGTFSISLGMGGMGNSIGAAIGAASLKTKRSLVFLGDGSFLIQGMEIHTALQYSFPVTFFIFNNNAHAMCATREKLFLKGESGINKFKSSFFAAGILKMFPGIPAREIYSMTDLEECLNDFKNARGPVVLSINISNTDNPPFLTFKRSVS